MAGPTDIKTVHGRWILDSRGNPTVAVDVVLERGSRGRAAAPSGASTGSHEALELRDGDMSCFFGLSVSEAVDNVNGPIAAALKMEDALDQRAVDQALIALDGTPNKGKLGANAILATSLAVAKAAASSRRIPLYRHLREMAWGELDPSLSYPLPLPMANVFNGGKHGGGAMEMQEFMLHPVGAKSFEEALRWISEGYHSLGRYMVTNFGPATRNVGDEGGFSGPVDKVEDVLNALVASIEECGFIPGDEIGIALDPASSEFYDAATNLYTVEGKPTTPGELIDLYKHLAWKYPITSIEDGLMEEDFVGNAELTKVLGEKLQIVGDDHFVTNTKRLELGIRAGSCNAMLLKVNQIGTLTEAIDAALMCYEHDYGVVVSHRSGETGDTTIADLAVGLCCGQIKTGAPARGERTAKYNRLLRIEEELGDRALFHGKEFRSSYRYYLPSNW
ncbi:phosphopyruvate hydratase [Candidatus Bathyarchaeota archaeon]|nr:phosphopyruvate hydratase [Candidatus Bathyarchaeota archaeon]